MEDSCSNYSSESEDADDLVYSYLKNRCYISEKEGIIRTAFPDITIDSREAQVQAVIAYDTSEHSVISFSTCSPDINLAEQQINAFKIWLTEMKDEGCQKEIYQMIMPMLCHVYLDCLRTNISACIKFLDRHAREPLVTKAWRPLVQELLSLQSVADIDKLPLVRTFRSCKSEIRLSTPTLIALRKFLTRRKCTLLLQVLRSRFKVESMTTDGNFVPEEDVVYSPSILKYSKQPNSTNNKPEEQKRVEKQNKVRKKKRKKSESVLENGGTGSLVEVTDACSQDNGRLGADNLILAPDNILRISTQNRLSSDNGRLCTDGRFNSDGQIGDNSKLGDDTSRLNADFRLETEQRSTLDNSRLDCEIDKYDRSSSDRLPVDRLSSENDRLSLERERFGERLTTEKERLSVTDRERLSIDKDRMTTTERERLVNDKEHCVPGDKELDDLVMEIMRMRLRPTPPPPLLLYTAHKTDGVVCGQVCRTGKFAATGDHRSELRVWCLSETKHNPQLHPSYFSSVNIQACTESKNDLQAVNRKQWWSLRGHSDTVYDCAFTPNSDYLLSVSYDTTMRLWNLHDYSCTAIYRGHTRPVWGVSISPVHNMVATSSSDKTARLWSLDRTFPIRILAGHTFDVMCCEFHPNGLYCATGGVDRSVRLWSVQDGNMVRAMGQLSQQDFVECLTFSPNGQYLASAGGDRWVWVWDIAGAGLLYRLECPASRLTSLAWSSDGSSIAASSHDGAVFLWHLDTPEEPYIPRKYTTKCSTVLSVQYSTKNSLVAVGLA